MESNQGTHLETSHFVNLTFSELPGLAQWADGFLRAKTAEHLSPGTLHFYRVKLKNFLAWCDKRNVSTVEALTPTDLRDFMLHLEDTGHNAGGVHGHYRTLRTFLKWFENEVEPDGWRNPCAKVKAPKLTEEPLDAIELADVEKLFKAAGRGRQGDRDHAILLTLADTGLRASELTALNLEDVDAFTGTIQVRKGKGGKSRHVFVGQRGRRVLRSWLKKRGAGAGALFTTETGGRLTYGGLRQIIRRAADRSKIPEPPLHSFRRFFAINYLRAGGDLLTLQRLLGHADLSLLRRYAKQNVDDLRASHAANSPVDRAGL